MRNLVYAFMLTAGCSLMAQPAAATGVGAAYTMSNATAGNEIIVFNRALNGTLSRTGSFPTGGEGSGGSLGNQSAIILSEDRRFLLAVNAGSNDVSVFRITPAGLILVDRRPSGGQQPVSLAEDDNFVYVLNAGSDNIFGFFLTAEGRLVPRPATSRPLSGSNTAPAQIAFSHDGRVLIITEKNTNTILTFRIVNGLPVDPKTFISAAPTPFGFSFAFRDQLIVSEAAAGAPNASAVSSYEVSREGDIDVISNAIGTTQTAACWIVITPDGRLAFASNTGSGTISIYRIDFDGTLRLIDPIGANIGPGSAPLDMALTPDGRFLYVLNSGIETISAYRVDPQQGKLTRITGVTNLPDGANGLAVR